MSREAWRLCTFEQSAEDVRLCADVLRRPPGQQEGLPAHQPGRARLGRVEQAGRQPVELRQVDVAEPEESAVSAGHVPRYAPVLLRLQGVLSQRKQNMRRLSPLILSFYLSCRRWSSWYLEDGQRALHPAGEQVELHPVEQRLQQLEGEPV